MIRAPSQLVANCLSQLFLHGSLEAVVLSHQKRANPASYLIGVYEGLPFYIEHRGKLLL